MVHWRRLSIFLAGLLAGLAPPVAHSGELNFTPSAHAIRGARIVPVVGEPLDVGTLVLRDGIIEALGSSLEIPADAVIHDGTGLTLYPGFIDLGTEAFWKEPEKPEDDGPSPGFASSLAELRPQLRSADHLVVSASGLEAWQKQGFTTLLTSPPGFGLTGLAALLSLREAAVGELLLDPEAALHANLKPAQEEGSHYPASRMGLLALLRQVVLDAEHYQLAHRRYQELRGTAFQRPAFDATLEALQPVLEKTRPILFQADNWLDGLQVLRLARETGVEVFLLGVPDAYHIVEQLVEAKTPVVLSLAFPKAPEHLEIPREAPLEQLRHHRNSVRSAVELWKQGIPFALTTQGLGSPGELNAAIRHILREGLPENVALEALTVQPARFLHREEMLGSLEVGKIANVLALEGDLFGKDSKPRFLFVDGQFIDLAQTGPSSDPSAKVELAGTWSLEARSPRGNIPVILQVTGQNPDYQGKITAMGMGLAVTSFQLQGNEAELTIDGSSAGVGGNIGMRLVFDGDSVQGSAAMPNGGAIDISGRRTSGPKEAWE